MKKLTLSLCIVCIGFPASSTQALLGCNLEKYRPVQLVAFEAFSDVQGFWYCGYPRSQAEYNMQMLCGKSH